MADQRDLHAEACQHLFQLEQIVDELKQAGPHPLDGDCALRNVAELFEALAHRARRGLS